MRFTKNESSSSDLSSDSDSSSSSCGSNCSCNKSASNCSSSSSSKSTTPEKRSVKKQLRSPSKEKSVDDEGSTREHVLLNVPESDLDTEINTSDEDFYEEHPFFVAPIEMKLEMTNNVPIPHYEKKISSLVSPTCLLLSPTRIEHKNKKRKKKPKITINLGNIQHHAELANLPYSNSVHAVTTAIDTTTVQSPIESTYAHTSAYQLSSTPSFSNFPCSTTVLTAATTTSCSTINSSSVPKRKRVKNKFYGYSSNEEMSGNESSKIAVQSTIKKHPPVKKVPKLRTSFIGIRAKKPHAKMMSKGYQNSSVSSSTSHASPADSSMYRISTPSNDVYHQRNFLKPVVPESSEDSDSDEKRHTLVINLPNLKEKLFKNKMNYSSSIAPSSYSNRVSLPASNSWFSHRQLQGPSHISSSITQTTPNKKEIYCFCRCPYDEVSEMIACDGPNCAIEWFHFECVGIMTAPKGQWFCPNCSKNLQSSSRSF